MFLIWNSSGMPDTGPHGGHLREETSISSGYGDANTDHVRAALHHKLHRRIHLYIPLWSGHHGQVIRGVRIPH